VGYCRAVKSENHIYVTGTAPVDEQGGVFAPGDAYSQAKRCFEIIQRALIDLGADCSCVVRTRMFVTDITRWAEFGRAHQEVFAENPPATTMVEVKALIHPEMLIEVEADAMCLSIPKLPINPAIFHVGFPATDFAKAKAFYEEGLGCEVGRETPNALVFNLYGNQIVAHTTDEPPKPQGSIYPRHFGIVFTLEADWQALLERVRQKQLPLYQQPKPRFVGQPGEHYTFFLEDPFYNILEFKLYRHSSAVFSVK